MKRSHLNNTDPLCTVWDIDKVVRTQGLWENDFYYCMYQKWLFLTSTTALYAQVLPAAVMLVL